MTEKRGSRRKFSVITNEETKEETKLCGDANCSTREPQPLSEFPKNRAREDGRHLYCKACCRRRMAKYRRSLKEYKNRPSKVVPFAPVAPHELLMKDHEDIVTLEEKVLKVVRSGNYERTMIHRAVRALDEEAFSPQDKEKRRRSSVSIEEVCEMLLDLTNRSELVHRKLAPGRYGYFLHPANAVVA